MSRSRHTDPLALRARRRLAAPGEARGAGDPARRRAWGRALRELGVAPPESSASRAAGPARRLRIVVRPAAPGLHHPAGRGDVRRVLEEVGPVGAYGLRSVELVAPPRPAPAGRDRLVFGRLVAPGRVLLFAQPVPPWRLAGRLAVADARRLERAGAVLHRHGALGATTVAWPGESLRRFMLHDVLLHEIGHHILQHNAGKRSGVIARTRDHESAAGRFVRRLRPSWLDDGASS